MAKPAPRRGQTAPAKQVRAPVRPMRKPVSRTPPWLGSAGVVAGLAVLVAAFLLYRYVATPPPPPPLDPDATQQGGAPITGLPQSQVEQGGTASPSNLI